MWDVFLSYSRREADQVRPVLDALRRRGLRVFIDDSGVAPFASISTTIAGELARSRALLAWYSAGYPRRRACQWELTAAYLAAQHEGDPRRRILVINPESGNDHIHPVELRDARHWLAGSPRAATHLSTSDMDVLAGHVAEHVAGLPGPLGAIAPLPPPRWIPAPPRLGAAHFVGRLPELWQIHSALRPASILLSRRGTVALCGPPGAGKTALAEEYALRFAAAYPGGVFWLTLDGAGRDGGLRNSLAAVASAIGIPDGGPVPRLLDGLAAALGERAAPYLWIVDDVPGELSSAAARLLAAPHPLGATLLVSTGTGFTATPYVEVPALPPDDAYLMLVANLDPVDPAELDAAAALAVRTGGLPAAVETVRARLRGRSARGRYVDTMAELREAAVTTLVPESGSARPARRTIQIVPRLTSVTDRERKAAFDIQVELATRVGLQPLGAGEGLLREALTSLHSLFQFTRGRLQGNTVSAPSSSVDSVEPLPHLEPVADRLLNEVLRPFLSHWHPRLLTHEESRPDGVSAREHEQLWSEAAALRADLAGLTGPMQEVTVALSEISGSDLGVRGLPNSE